MRIRHTVVVATAALGFGALAAVPLACSASAEIAGPTREQPAAVVAPIDKLNAAVARTRSADFAITIKVGSVTLPGLYDGQTRLSQLTLVTGPDESIKVIASPTTLYASGIQGVSAAYAAVDVSKLLPGAAFAFAADPVVGLALASTGVTDVTETDPNVFRGVVNLNRVTGGANTLRAASHLAAVAADTSSAVQFTAAITSAGLLTSFQATFSADGTNGLTYAVEYSAFGSPISVTLPEPTTVVPAPSGAYTYPN